MTSIKPKADPAVVIPRLRELLAAARRSRDEWRRQAKEAKAELERLRGVSRHRHGLEDK